MSATIDKTKITLTESQQEAVQEITKFWEDESQIDFLLKGQAGCGKTTVLKAAVMQLTNEPVVIATAPTHEACRALELSLNGTGTPIKTTHSFLGLRLNFNSLNPYLTQGKLPENFFDFNLMLVDEASMVGCRNRQNPKSKNQILDYAMDRGSLKRIWIGDEAQLPPIEKEADTSSDSPIFSLGLPEVELTQVMRHEGNTLNYVRAVREQIWASARSLPDPKQFAITSVSRRNDGLGNFSDEAIAQVLEGTGHILCWTNARTKYSKLAGVAEYNQFFKQLKHGSTSEDFFVGDTYIFRTPYMRYLKGEEDMLEDWESLSTEDLEANDAEKLSYKTSPIISINSRATILQIAETSLLGFKALRLTVAVENGANSQVFVCHPEAKTKLKEYLNDLKAKAVHYAKIGDQARYGACSEAMHNISNLFADLKPNWAFTVHVSQGQSLKNVFVDTGNILQCKDRKIAFKLLYVATSRAVDTLTLIRGG